MSYSLILLLAVAGDALPFGHSRSRDLGIVDSYMQDLHESAVKEITAHRYEDNGSLPSSSSSSDRYLQIKNPCGYVKLNELEETYRSATGVAFECSCQAYGFSDSGETTCESKEPFCCSSNFDEGMDCTTATEKAVFSVVPFSGYFVPRPRSSRVCMTFTGDDERKDSEICRTNEFARRQDTFDGTFTCQAMFDGSLCRDCTQCSDGSEGGAYDCSNVARSSNFQVTCDGGNGPNRTCRAQYGGKVTNTEPPTPSPSKTPTSPAPTLRPTPVPVQKDLPSTSTLTPKEDAPAEQPTQPAQSDKDSDRENADDSLQMIVGPQSVLCADGFCTLSDEEAAQQCNFYALSKYGDAHFNSDGKAIVENINTAKGPIAIGQGCVMECRGCYLVLSPDGAATSSGFSSRSWSFAGTSMIAVLLATIGLL